jgi:hypothetical protein
MGKNSCGWDTGKRKGECRTGGGNVKADKGESEDLVVGDWTGIGQESFPDSNLQFYCLNFIHILPRSLSYIKSCLAL